MDIHDANDQSKVAYHFEPGHLYTISVPEGMSEAATREVAEAFAKQVRLQPEHLRPRIIVMRGGFDIAEIDPVNM